MQQVGEHRLAEIQPFAQPFDVGGTEGADRRRADRIELPHEQPPAALARTIGETHHGFNELRVGEGAQVLTLELEVERFALGDRILQKPGCTCNSSYQPLTISRR